MFTNPVYDGSFADPQIIAVGNEYFAFATNGPLGNVQTLTSTDLVSWRQVGDALPSLPDWTAPGRVWAPEVAVHAADRYVMYYTTRSRVRSPVRRRRGRVHAPRSIYRQISTA